jgi:hypothetical protein
VYSFTSLPINILSHVEHLFNQPGIFNTLYQKAEVTSHMSSVLATLGIFFFIENSVWSVSENKLKQYISAAELSLFRKKWLPLLSVLAIIAFHGYFESSLGSNSNTPDSLDFWYGIISIVPGYIAAQYLIRKETDITA